MATAACSYLACYSRKFPHYVVEQVIKQTNIFTDLNRKENCINYPRKPFNVFPKLFIAAFAESALIDENGKES